MEVNIFDFYNENTKNLLDSLDKAKLKRKSLFVHYEGDLPENGESPFTFFTSITEKNRSGLFFNNVKVPVFYDIRHADSMGASIEYFRKTVGRINYRERGYRLVESVEWYESDYEKNVVKKDLYNIAGDHYATVFFSKGKAYSTEYYKNGLSIITEYIQTGVIQLLYKGKIHYFSNLTQFFLYYLEEIKVNPTDIIINSLSYPLFISRAIDKPGVATLFWQEKFGKNIPGNMADELNNPKALRKIVFNREEYLSEVEKEFAETNIQLDYLSNIENFVRSTKYRAKAFILTESDNIVGLDDILSTFPDFEITVAAYTNMSDKLLAYSDRHPNIKLIPLITDKQVQVELINSDIYLDINSGNKVGDILKDAYLEDMLILSHSPFKMTEYKSFSYENTKDLADALGYILSKQSNWDQQLKKMHEQEGKQSAVQDYVSVLSLPNSR